MGTNKNILYPNMDETIEIMKKAQEVLVQFGITLGKAIAKINDEIKKSI